MTDHMRENPDSSQPPMLNVAPEGPRWYVVQTLANREFGANAQLQAQEFSTFFPQLLKTVRHARKLRTVRAPLFPGYLFVKLDLARDRWRSVNGTFGVARLVMARDRPAPAPVGVVECLREMADGQGMVRLDRGLDAGQRVELLAGPFARALGRIECMESAGRVRVLLEIMGGAVPVHVDRAALRTA